MKQLAVLICVSLVLLLPVKAQEVFPFASKENRDTITAQLINQVHTSIVLPLHKNNYARLTGAYWAMELMLYRPSNMHSVIVSQFPKLPSTPEWYQRSFMEMLYTLYPGTYSNEVKRLWTSLASPKVKAMALEYLSAAGHEVAIPDYPEDSLQLHFYYRAKHRNHNKVEESDLLDKDLLPKQLLVVSFQFRDRNKPGYLMIRTEGHKWVKNEDGTAFKAPQLARAITNLPWYLTNGNTPQGLYKLGGFDSSSIDWIGPTTNLQMQMPFETSRSNFFGDSSTTWNEGYARLLGPLAAKEQLWESYYAGKLGRTEIIAHGTTINPEYYKNQVYYPNTPSLGCLCSPEIWNNDGRLVESAQQRWITKLKQTGEGYGYLIVVEVNE